MILKILSAVFLIYVAGFAKYRDEFSLTTTPDLFLVPEFQISGEYLASKNCSGSATLGYGIPTLQNGAGEKFHVPEFVVGGGFAFYAIGNFRNGLQLGAELLLFNLFPPKQEGFSQSLNASRFGPLIGYKWVAATGFTLVAQAGYGFSSTHVSVKDDLGHSGSFDSNSKGSFLRGNLGWTFDP